MLCRESSANGIMLPPQSNFTVNNRLYLLCQSWPCQSSLFILASTLLFAHLHLCMFSICFIVTIRSFYFFTSSLLTAWWADLIFPVGINKVFLIHNLKCVVLTIIGNNCSESDTVDRKWPGICKWNTSSQSQLASALRSIFTKPLSCFSAASGNVGVLQCSREAWHITKPLLLFLETEMLISQEVCWVLWVWSLNACPAALNSTNYKRHRHSHTI